MEQWLLWTILPSLRAAIKHKVIDTRIDAHPNKTLIEHDIRLPPVVDASPCRRSPATHCRHAINRSSRSRDFRPDNSRQLGRGLTYRRWRGQPGHPPGRGRHRLPDSGLSRLSGAGPTRSACRSPAASTPLPEGAMRTLDTKIKEVGHGQPSARYPRHWCRRVLCAPPQPLGARDQRKRQPAHPPLPTYRNPITSHQPNLDVIAYEPSNSPEPSSTTAPPTQALNRLVTTTH